MLLLQVVHLKKGVYVEQVGGWVGKRVGGGGGREVAAELVKIGL